MRDCGTTPIAVALVRSYKHAPHNLVLKVSPTIYTNAYEVWPAIMYKLSHVL